MKESNVQPKRIFDKFLSLAERNTEVYFKGSDRTAINCLACDSSGDFAFEKYGFKYELCPNCQILFVNPRPIASAFSKYYTESPSPKYWGTIFYKETAEARRFRSKPMASRHSFL